MGETWDTQMSSSFFMFIDLNDQLCQTKENDMFIGGILDKYATRILDAKYNQVDTYRTAANQKHTSSN